LPLGTAYTVWTGIGAVGAFVVYAGDYILATFRNLEAQEKALDEQPYGDCVFVHPELRGIGAAARKDTGGVGAASSSGSVKHDIAHRNGSVTR
jgi:hypothetical protein